VTRNRLVPIPRLCKSGCNWVVLVAGAVKVGATIDGLARLFAGV
jgi:hypothetical protein